MCRPVGLLEGVFTWMCDVYVYMHKHERLGESGDMLPHEIFEIIDSLRLASEAILGQKQSFSSYMAHRFVCYIHFLAQFAYAFAMPADY